MEKVIITDGQTDVVLDWINKKDVIDNDHEQDKSVYLETFSFTAFANKRYAQYLTDKNRVIIPGEDGEYREFVIKFTDRYKEGSGTNLIDVEAFASYQELVGSKVIRAGTTASQSAEAHAREILAGTEVQLGNIAYTGLRSITRDNHTDPFSALKSLATLFNLELDFRVEVNGNKITRYADLVKRVGEWRGRHVEFGKDLQGIRRIEETDNIVTALLVLGPERENGSRLEVFVEDEDARKRWGRRGQHIVAVYEPQSTDQDMTEERLTSLGRTELNKRINAIVRYEGEIVDLEHVPGMQNKKIRYGDTIKIKDTSFNPPLFVDARIFKQNRNIFNKASKRVGLGDFREYTVEEIRFNWKSIQDEIEKKVKRAEIRAGFGDIRFTIIGYVEPLKAEKSSIDSKFASLANNLDLDTGIRSTLATVKANYDNAYSVLMATIDNTTAKDELSESDLEYVNGQYASYEIELAALTEQFETATDAISKKKANDAEDGANQYTDDSLIPVNQELERAQREIDQAIIDIGEANLEIGNAKERLDSAETGLTEADRQISDAYTELENLENLLVTIDRDKVDLVDYNQKINEITNDIASKVDGEWVDGKLQVAIDGIEVGERNLILGTRDFSSPWLVSGGTLSEIDGQVWVESGYQWSVRQELSSNKIELGKTYTVSVDCRNDNNVDTTARVMIALWDKDGNRLPSDREPRWYFNIKAGEVKRVSGSYKIQDEVSRGVFYLLTELGHTAYAKFSLVKFTKGNKQTEGWTPAPEDIWADIDLKANADNVYTIADINGMFDNVVSITQYQADQNGIVSRFTDAESRIYQNERAIGGKVSQTDYNADQATLENRMTEWERTADGIEQSVSSIRTDFDNLEIGGRNLIPDSKRVRKAVRHYIAFISDNPFSEGDTVTVSYEVRTVNGKEINHEFYLRSMDGTGITTIVSKSIPKISGEWTKVKGTLKIPSSINEVNKVNLTIRSERYMTSDGQDYETEVRYIKLEKGNKATDWTPAPEDGIEYTNTKFTQLSNEISLNYVKDNELIAGIRIGDAERIGGANVEITGDTRIYGNLEAADAIFLNMTTENMTAINAIIENSTITGNLTATDATFLKGTFDEATIIDATIQNATITGRLSGVTGTFAGELRSARGTFTGELIAATGTFEGDMTAGSISSNTSISVNTDINVGDNVVLGSNLAGSTVSIGRVWGGAIANDYAMRLNSDLRIDINAPTLYFVQNGRSIRPNRDGFELTGDVTATGDLSANKLTTVSTIEYTVSSHAYIRPRPGYELRIADVNANYSSVRAASYLPPSSTRESKKNINIYSTNVLEGIRDMNVYTFLYNWEDDTAHNRLGIMLDEAPDIIKAGTMDTVDLYSMSGYILKGLKDTVNYVDDEINWLKVENQVLKNEVTVLKNKVQQLEEMVA